MNRRDFLQAAAWASVLLAGVAHKAQAQTPPRRDLRLVFARGGDLFACPSLDGTDARRVLSLGAANALWAVSPDGRRVVWMTQNEPPQGDADAAVITHQGLGARPATIFLSDMLGRHQKKLLTTNELRDRQGRPVIRAGVDNAEDLASWRPVSLGWSADGRTVYLGCANTLQTISASGDTWTTKRATFAADGVSGSALVDGDGRWKLLAPLSHIDAQGGLLVGLDASITQIHNEPTGLDTEPTTSPLRSFLLVPFGGPVVIVNAAEGGTRTVLGSGKAVNGAAPSYDEASGVCLAPDHRNIAYVSGAVDGGLWMRDRWAASSIVPRKLAPKASGRPQWTENSATVFFTVRSSEETPVVPLDLYQVDVPANDAKTTQPRLVIKNVDGFALAPL